MDSERQPLTKDVAADSQQSMPACTLGFYGSCTQTVLRVFMMYIFGYTLILLMCMIISFTSQAIFNGFGNTYEGMNSPYLNSFVVPMLIYLLSFLVIENVYIFADALDWPTLPSFRASLAIALKWPPHKMQLIDNSIMLAWLLFPLIGALVWAVPPPKHAERRSFSELRALMVTGFYTAALVLACLLILVQTITKLIVESNGKRRLMSNNFELALKRTVQTQGYKDLVVEEAITADVVQVSRLAILGIIASILSLGSNVTSMLFEQLWIQCNNHSLHYCEIVIYVFNVCQISLIALLIGCTWKALPKRVAGPFLFVTVAMLGIAILVFVGDIMEVMESSGANNIPFFTKPLSGQPTFNLSTRTSSTQYPICTMQFGFPFMSRETRLTVLDIGVLAEVVYERDHHKLKTNTFVAFKGTHLEGHVDFIYPKDVDHVNMVGRPVLFKLEKAAACVLSFRGTHTLEDALADLDMWSTVKGLQTLSVFAPLFEVMPEYMIQRLTFLLDLSRWLGYETLWDYMLRKVTPYVEDCRSDGFDVIVTGHSLGGGIAQIAGVRLQATTVTFSPVGVRYSLHHFGMGTELLLRQSLTSVIVKPLRDLVPEIDKQIGLTQDIDCAATTALGCHSLRQTLCELFASCGDPRSRVNEFCESDYGVGSPRRGL